MNYQLSGIIIVTIHQRITSRAIRIGRLLFVLIFLISLELIILSIKFLLFQWNQLFLFRKKSWIQIKFIFSLILLFVRRLVFWSKLRGVWSELKRKVVVRNCRTIKDKNVVGYACQPSVSVPSAFEISSVDPHFANLDYSSRLTSNPWNEYPSP